MTRERYIPTWKPVYAADGDVGPLGALAFNDGFVRVEAEGGRDAGTGRPCRRGVH